MLVFVEQSLPKKKGPSVPMAFVWTPWETRFAGGRSVLDRCPPFASASKPKEITKTVLTRFQRIFYGPMV